MRVRDLTWEQLIAAEAAGVVLLLALGLLFYGKTQKKKSLPALLNPG